MAIAERELAPQARKQFYTEEEYLVREDAAEERSEYVNGELQPMSGGTGPHGLIWLNLATELKIALRGRGWAVLPSDVKIMASGQMYYPDVSMVSGEIIYHGGKQIVVTNPCLLAEVSSPSTEKFDRGEKLREYLAIPTLQVYLLVSQNSPHIEMYSRAGNEPWNFQEVFGLDAVLEIAVLSISLAIRDVYDLIKFD